MYCQKIKNNQKNVDYVRKQSGLTWKIYRQYFSKKNTWKLLSVEFERVSLVHYFSDELRMKYFVKTSLAELENMSRKN